MLAEERIGEGLPSRDRSFVPSKGQNMASALERWLALAATRMGARPQIERFSHRPRRRPAPSAESPLEAPASSGGPTQTPRHT